MKIHMLAGKWNSVHWVRIGIYIYLPLGHQRGVNDTRYQPPKKQREGWIETQPQVEVTMNSFQPWTVHRYFRNQICLSAHNFMYHTLNQECCLIFYCDTSIVLFTMIIKWQCKFPGLVKMLAPAIKFAVDFGRHYHHKIWSPSTLTCAGTLVTTHHIYIMLLLLSCGRKMANSYMPSLEKILFCYWLLPFWAAAGVDITK